MSTSPTARSLAMLRKAGYTANVVEKWIPQTKRRLDLFGGIDIVAIRAGDAGALGVQSTSGDNVSHRLKKMRGIAALKLWLDCGNRLVIHGWSRKRKAGTRKLWTCREEPVTFCADWIESDYDERAAYNNDLAHGRDPI